MRLAVVRGRPASGSVLACRLWLTLRITRTYSRNGGEVYSATLGSLATSLAAAGASALFSPSGDASTRTPRGASASINSARANEAGSSTS